MLSNQWIVRDFYPIDYVPRGVRLTAYSGDARDLPAAVLQSFLDAVAAGRLTVPVHRIRREGHRRSGAGARQLNERVVATRPVAPRGPASNGSMVYRWAGT